MLPSLATSALLLLPLLATATASASALPRQLEKRATAPTDLGGFYNASENGGKWLTLAANTGGLGEPLNIVISALSSSFIMTTEGLTDFMWSINYSEEFLGQSLGERQAADLGDGNGQLNQTDILRYNFGDPNYGTLKESINGGSHVRYWRQNGTEANSGAWFIAASNEESAALNHMIVPNGYDLGRDEFTSNATIPGGTISPQTNRTFESTVQWMDGFLKPNSSEGVNHGIMTDGRVAVITVRVTGEGDVQEASSASLLTPTPTDRYQLLLLLSGLLGAVALAVLV